MVSSLIIILGYILARFYRDRDEEVGMILFLVAGVIGALLGCMEIPLTLQVINNIFAR